MSRTFTKGDADAEPGETVELAADGRTVPIEVLAVDPAEA